MPLSRSAADAFGVITISLVALFAILGLICICLVTYFRVHIRKRGLQQLNYFCGPWVIRIILLLIAIWWSIWEITRLSFLKERLFSSLTWKRNICKAYILSNLGFSEPCIVLSFVFLLRASLQNRESDTLSQRWNRKTMGYVILYCLPGFLAQCFLVLALPKFINEDQSNGRAKMTKYFTRTSLLIEDYHICTYPLFSTIILGLFYVVSVTYVTYVGIQMLSFIINKRLRRRLYWLISVVAFFIPMRAVFLGLSVLPQPGNFSYEIFIFLAFISMLSCTIIIVVMLVYYPVSDSMALRDMLGPREMEGAPYDDYYYDGASLITNQSRHEAGRSSDASTKPGSISFRTMIRDDATGSDLIEESSLYSHNALHIDSPFGSSPMPSRPMLPLREVPAY